MSPRILRILLLTACAVALRATAFAKNLYVSTSGDDSVAYAGNDTAHPWATVNEAWQQARPGDNVFFRAGTYVISSQIWTKYTGYDGTAEAPITFQNYPGESATISADPAMASLGPDGAIVIERAYNIVRGLNFIGAGPAGTFFRVGYDVGADHFQITDCTATMTVGGDNAAFLKLGPISTNALAQRLKITGPGLMAQGVNSNTSCIYTGMALSVKVLNCELSNAPMGIYFKHANTEAPSSNEFAYNYIADTDRFAFESNSNFTWWHDNVIGARNAQVYFTEANGLTGGDYNTITHNTFFGSSFTLSCEQDGNGLPGSQFNTVKDNIFLYTSGYHPASGCSGISHNTISDYNLFPVGDVVTEYGINYSLPDWQVHSGGDAHSISAAPTFAAGPTPDTIAGFKLGIASAGRSAASDGKDMGAQICAVGINAICASTTASVPPARPVGLTLQ